MASPSQQQKQPPNGKRFMVTSGEEEGESSSEQPSCSLQDGPETDDVKVRSSKRPKEDSRIAEDGADEAEPQQEQQPVGSSSSTSLSLSSFPGDVICDITCFLDVQSLLTMRLLNRSFRTQASTGASGWKGLCHVLWRNKIHISQEAISHPDPMEGYRLSVLDARNRDYVSPEELMYHPETQQGTIWSFRFKESAGPDWTSWDPWYNGLPCRKMVFLENGAVKTYVPASSKQAPPPPSSPQQQQQPPTQEGLEQNNGVIDTDTDTSTGPVLMDPPMAMNWRFLTRPLDLPARPTGSYIRFDVGGRDVPTYCVRRSPTQNWGFIMESCWGIFASFELPKRPLGDITTTRRIRQRGRRIRRAQDRAGNWFHVEVDDSEASSLSGAEDEEDGNENDNDEANIDVEQANRDALLIDDSHFSITSGLQWREAFLYNFGARVLPEGDEAVADFDRTYGAVMHQD